MTLLRILLTLLLVLPVAARADVPAHVSADDLGDEAPYTCMRLDDALRELSTRGLPLLWSDGLVQPDLQIESNRVANYVQPLDTGEHLLFFDLDLRRGAGLAILGIETAWREDWRAWGLDGAEEVNDQFSVVRAAYGTYKRFSDRNSLGAELVLSKGFDLDRFSRLPFTQAREIVVGFGSGRGFDEGAFAGVTWATSLFRKVPITFLLEGGHQRIEDEEWIDRVGISARFLVHGPLKLDVWPILGYGIASSVDGEAGNVSYGLVLRRRY